MSLENVIEDVSKFHKACDIVELETPTLPDESRRKLRRKLIEEEFQEFIDAEEENDIVEVADALADLIYVICGTALEYGIPLTDVWNEVQRSNMAKINPETGKVIKRADGKILKPKSWQPPDIAGILGVDK